MIGAGEGKEMERGGRVWSTRGKHRSTPAAPKSLLRTQLRWMVKSVSGFILLLKATFGLNWAYFTQGGEKLM